MQSKRVFQPTGSGINRTLYLNLDRLFQFHCLTLTDNDFTHASRKSVGYHFSNLLLYFFFDFLFHFDVILNVYKLVD